MATFMRIKCSWTVAHVAFIDFDEAFAGDPATISERSSPPGKQRIGRHLAADRVLPVSEAFLEGYRDAARVPIKDDRIASTPRPA